MSLHGGGEIGSQKPHTSVLRRAFRAAGFPSPVIGRHRPANPHLQAWLRQPLLCDLSLLLTGWTQYHTTSRQSTDQYYATNSSTPSLLPPHNSVAGN